ncbi:MAG TPA: DUF5522 domain-containing protein [Candidatus Nanoarchaeia archaeon]|nr:DUF5522 domain-containing protein [Candidatus Nanoarchaeia archaeon]
MGTLSDDEHQKLCMEIHEERCRNGQESYQDPKTDLQVFTRIYLLKRPCCQTGCRHCPYGFKKEIT